MAAHIQLGPTAAQGATTPTGHTATWTGRAILLWSRRQLLLRLAAASMVLSICIVLLIPKEYESTARIMPPDQAGSGASLLALMATRSSSLGPLSSLASGLIGAH